MAARAYVPRAKGVIVRREVKEREFKRMNFAAFGPNAPIFFAKGTNGLSQDGQFYSGSVRCKPMPTFLRSRLQGSWNGQEVGSK